MEELIIKNGVIVTFGRDFRILKGYEIVIANGLILEIRLSNNYENHSDCKNIIDAGNRIIMPGYINCHTHLYSEFAKGMPVKSSSRNFYEILNNIWWKLDKSLTKEAIYLSAFIGLLNCIKSGTTSIIDHHSSPGYIEGSLKELVKAFSETGIRGVLSYELSDRDGKDKFKQSINDIPDSIDYIKEYNMLNLSIGLHAAFTLCDESLGKIKSIYDEYNIPIHTHIAEDIFDKDYNIYTYGLTSIQRLLYFGLLDDRSILAHCVHLTNEDEKIINSVKANIIHNPQSNLNNKVGTFNLFSAMENGIQVALGTDGISSNMAEEYNIAYLIHKNCNKKANNVEELIRKIMMESNPSVISKFFSSNIGEIKNDYAADLIIVDYIPSSDITESNFMAHYLYGISKSRVMTTISNGKILMNNFEVAIDEDYIQEIYKQARKSAAKMFESV